MEKRAFCVLLSIISTVIALLIWLNISVKQETPYDAVYEMANQRIEWSGAGYSGIYAR